MASARMARGCSLQERLCALNARKLQRLQPWDSSDGAARRYRLWRAGQGPLPSDDLYRFRLRHTRLTDRQFRALLDLTPEQEQLLSRSGPAWIRNVNAVLDGASRPGLVAMGIDLAAGRGILGAPFAVRALDELSRAVRHLQSQHPILVHLLAPDAAVRLLAPQLLLEINQLVEKTFVLEVNIARLEGVLARDSSAERYAEFIEHLANPAHTAAILARYPVLGRQLSVRADLWVESSVEWLTHLAGDCDALRQTFLATGTIGPIIDISGGHGESHRRGRSVKVITFASGLRLVYKPRSLSTDCGYVKAIQWVNEQGNVPTLTVPRVVNRSTHGWMEYFDHRPCETDRQLKDFYRRQGAHLAMLYTLAATDIHYENVVAHGDQPIIVDLETLFQAPGALYGGRGAEGDDGSKSVKHSVLNVGLLPGFVFGPGNRGGWEGSGLGGDPGQEAPFLVPVIENDLSDQMRLQRKQVTANGARNRPVADGIPSPATAYVGQILEGFHTTYSAIMRHRDQWLCKGGIVDAFRGSAVRVVVRPTYVYLRLLREASHPDALQDAADCERLFDHLWKGIPQQPSLARTTTAELQDLWNGDVPYFWTNVHAHSLRTSTGRSLRRFFLETGEEYVRRRIAALSPRDREKQKWFVQASFAAAARGQPVRASKEKVQAPSAAGHELRLAKAIARRLDALCLDTETGKALWFGLSLVNENAWMIEPIASGLYSGTLGIGVFYAALARLTGVRRWRRMAERIAADTGSYVLEAERSGTLADLVDTGGVGAFAGVGGYVYALTLIAHLLDDHKYEEAAAAVMPYLPGAASADRHLDVISGVSGCALALLSAERLGLSTDPAPVLAACAARLLDTATVDGTIATWPTPLATTAPLTGFSHGAAGIAAALFALGSRLGDPRLTKLGRAALAYERSTFDAKVGNWPDFRAASGGAMGGHGLETMLAWCHGAPGIALGRVIVGRYEVDSVLLKEIADAAAATSTCIDTGNHCLCHGDLGNLECLAEAARFADRSEWMAAGDQAVAAILSRASLDGWRCGVPLGIEVPGFMTGLAGIGYTLLRRLQPRRFPSVLMLQAPDEL